MKLAVVQHLLRAQPDQYVDVVTSLVKSAAIAGADLVLLPAARTLQHSVLEEGLWRRLEDVIPDTPVFVVTSETRDVLPVSVDELGILGRTAFLRGDESLDPEMHEMLLDYVPDVLVLTPGAESELQAEAVLELAVALSTSLAPVVLVVEPDGAELGEPGHGGSAIIYLGEVLAEAGAGDDVLVVELDSPGGPPSPRDALPRPAPILAQRLRAHEAQRTGIPQPGESDEGPSAAAW